MNPATPTRRLVRHSASYLVGQSLFFLSRLVFYCAFTRLFAPESYGYLNLITSALLFFIVGVRLGQNDSLIRFLPEGNKRGLAKKYVASVVVPTLAFAVVAVAGLVVLANAVATHLHLSDDLRWALCLATPIVGLRVGFDLTYAILRSLEQPDQAVALDAARNWITLLASLALVFAWRASMAPFFLGQLGGELIIFAACLWIVGRHFSLAPSQIEKPIMRESLRYGLPMVGYHLAAVGLLYMDRYLILAFVGANAVGQYSAGYNLAMMVQQFIAVPVGLAVAPLYMNLWSRGETENARAFVQTTLRWFWLGIWPCLFGMVAVKSDLIVLLATEKYLESSAVIGYVLLGCLLYGGYPIYAAGLLVHKKTGTMCLWMIVALGINIAANLVLIPRFYIMGAAVATTLSYSVLAVGLAAASRRYMRLRFWPREATIYLAGAFVMFAAVSSISLTSPWASLGARLTAGVLIYGGWLMVADGELRRRMLAKALG